MLIKSPDIGNAKVSATKELTQFFSTFTRLHTFQADMVE